MRIFLHDLFGYLTVAHRVNGGEVFIAVLCFNTEHRAEVFFVAENNVNIGHQRLRRAAGVRLAPERAAVVEIIACGRAVLLRSLERVQNLLRRVLAQCRHNAGGVEPAGVKHGFPVDIARLDLAERGVAAVIDLIACARADADLNERQTIARTADLVKRLDNDVRHIDTVHSCMLDDIFARPVVDQFRNISGLLLRHQTFDAQVGDVDAAVELCGCNAQLQRVRLSETVVVRRRHADVRFAEAHEIILCHA